MTLFSNATLMQSKITLREGLASVTNENRAMVGQAPYTVNAGVTWNTTSGATSATLLFNTVGARIIDAGERPLPDVKELARNVVDFSLKFPVAGRFSGRVDAKNLLDAQYRIKQGPVTRETYFSGRTFSMGFTYQP